MRCESIVHSLLGKISPISASTLSASVCSVQLPAAHETAEVGVDGQTGDAEGIAEHDERGLAAHAGERDQVL